MSRLLPLPDSLDFDSEQFARAVRAAFDAIEVWERWHFIGGDGEPGFLSGFSNFNTLSHIAARFRRNALGDVQFHGTLAATTGIGQGNTNKAWTMPEGYRTQGGVEIFPCAGTAAGVHYPGFIEVFANGDVKPTLLGLANGAAITKLAVYGRYRAASV
jgi:hypothetical protein